VVDQEGTVVYKQVVQEMTEEPDYDAAIEAVQKLKS
jgi:peroxiredoxin